MVNIVNLLSLFFHLDPSRAEEPCRVHRHRSSHGSRVLRRPGVQGVESSQAGLSQRRLRHAPRGRDYTVHERYNGEAAPSTRSDSMGLNPDRGLNNSWYHAFVTFVVFVTPVGCSSSQSLINLLCARPMGFVHAHMWRCAWTASWRIITRICVGRTCNVSVCLFSRVARNRAFIRHRRGR